MQGDSIQEAFNRIKCACLLPLCISLAQRERGRRGLPILLCNVTEVCECLHVYVYVHVYEYVCVCA
jgi:hypothetical protein